MAKPLKQIPLVVDGEVEGGGTAVTQPISSSEYWKKTVFIKGDRDMDVYVVGGPTELEMYQIKSGYMSGGAALDDTDYKWEPNDAMECFEIDIYLPYTSIIIKNMDGSNALTFSIHVGGVGQ